MKMRKEVFVGILMVTLTGAAGIVIPSCLFRIQERRMLTNVERMQNTDSETEESDTKLVIEEAELRKIIRSMNREGTTYYHEPMQGQLNMSSAVEWAIQSVGKLLGQEELSINNFITITAVLQTKEEAYKSKPQYSYWNIQMSKENEKIHVWMNSVSGMILKMDVDLYDESDMNAVDLEELLGKYLSYSGFHMSEMEEELYNEYKTAVERYCRGKYFDCFAAKYQCNSPEQLDRQYITAMLGIEPKIR